MPVSKSVFIRDIRCKGIYWEERVADHTTKFLNVAKIIQYDGPLPRGDISVRTALAMADELNDLLLMRRYGERA